MNTITQTQTFNSLNDIQKSIYNKPKIVKQIIHASNLIKIGKTEAVSIQGIMYNIAVELAHKN